MGGPRVALLALALVAGAPLAAMTAAAEHDVCPGYVMGAYACAQTWQEAGGPGPCGADPASNTEQQHVDVRVVLLYNLDVVFFEDCNNRPNGGYSDYWFAYVSLWRPGASQSVFFWWAEYADDTVSWCTITLETNHGGVSRFCPLSLDPPNVPTLP